MDTHNAWTMGTNGHTWVSAVDAVGACITTPICP